MNQGKSKVERGGNGTDTGNSIEKSLRQKLQGTLKKLHVPMTTCVFTVSLPTEEIFFSF